ncbi:DNA cytosine methyltransferase [Methylobacterium sp. E-046]|uniref:DNA cytosine methyltransferase n=1 Tax=Methylobacterium sp. E-046 TaxID=2836576 RepID=UPI001FBB0271|nr:DNA cytosine methyltransferase [Methylobacterium sp. E-046]MCJ2101011.1 DNA cytosine methyltransferase [Methylobacterium sp. E-046]
MRTPVAISLFSGAGGLDHGFEAAGFRIAAALEVDPCCAETLRASRPWPVIERDIAEVPTSELLRVAGIKIGQADALIGGPPCQPFSKAGFWATGQARRLDDPRASTLGQYLRVLAEAQPRTFLLENVEGLGFRGKDEGLKLITEALASINAATGSRYSASMAVLNAADYGVPQLRRRLFIVGARNGSKLHFPAPTHADPTSLDWATNGQRWRTTWDALHDLPNDDDPALQMRGKWAALMPSIPEGQNYLWHTARGGGEPLFGWRRRYWSFLLKLAKDQPSWTLAAQPGPATGPFHWSGRRLSAREMARLQTFPDDVLITGSLADAQRQLGNAVPSLLAETIARAMREQLLRLAVETEEPRLSVRAASVPTPPPARVAKVPKAYHALRGQHEAHPGTGLGYGVAARLRSSGKLIAAE